jgi:hypothetical protein
MKNTALLILLALSTFISYPSMSALSFEWSSIKHIENSTFTDIVLLIPLIVFHILVLGLYLIRDKPIYKVGIVLFPIGFLVFYIANALILFVMAPITLLGLLPFCTVWILCLIQHGKRNTLPMNKPVA